ncbi:hypothetical protein [Streptomyces sp. NPDC048392]
MLRTAHGAGAADAVAAVRPGEDEAADGLDGERAAASCRWKY